MSNSNERLVYRIVHAQRVHLDQAQNTFDFTFVLVIILLLGAFLNQFSLLSLVVLVVQPITMLLIAIASRRIHRIWLENKQDLTLERRLILLRLLNPSFFLLGIGLGFGFYSVAAIKAVTSQLAYETIVLLELGLFAITLLLLPVYGKSLLPITLGSTPSSQTSTNTWKLGLFLVLPLIVLGAPFALILNRVAELALLELFAVTVVSVFPIYFALVGYSCFYSLVLVLFSRYGQ